MSIIPVRNVYKSIVINVMELIVLLVHKGIFWITRKHSVTNVLRIVSFVKILLYVHCVTKDIFMIKKAKNVYNLAQIISKEL